LLEALLVKAVVDARLWNCDSQNLPLAIRWSTKADVRNIERAIRTEGHGRRKEKSRANHIAGATDLLLHSEEKRPGLRSLTALILYLGRIRVVSLAVKAA
jgi:hypothetical protein